MMMSKKVGKWVGKPVKNNLGKEKTVLIMIKATKVIKMYEDFRHILWSRHQTEYE